jgi:O-antigen/teichoic acid export membrane protein
VSVIGAVQAGPVEGKPVGSLRDSALRSGAYLTVRETLGAAMRLAGLVVVMRQIGPAAFGVFSAAAAYVRFPTTLAQMGAEVFVVRQPGPLARRTYDEVFTFLLVASVVVVAAGLGLSFLVAPWLRPFGVLAPLRVLLFAIPINILWSPYQACIERQFAYRRMGLLELGGDVVLYATAAPMALMGYGAWSLVAGFFAWQAWLLAGSIVLSGVRPRLAWSKQTARALVVHGRTYSLSSWISAARGSIVTVVVAAFAGATGVGLMSFATRFVTTMNFTDRGVHRVGMVAMSKARTHESSRMSAAIEEGTLLLLVVTAIPLVVFGLSAHWVIPGIFGRKWLPALPLYVLLALWAILRIPMNVQRTLLYARGRNMPPAITGAIELAIVSLVSLVAVRELGIVGYGIASVVGVSSTVYIHRSARRLVVVRYRRLVVPMIGLIPPVCVPLVPSPWSLLLLLPPVLLVVHPTTRQELTSIVATARATIARRQDRPSHARPSPVEHATVCVARSDPSPLLVATVAHVHAGAGVEMAMNGSARGSWKPAASRQLPYASWREGLPAEVAPAHDLAARPGTWDAAGRFSGASSPDGAAVFPAPDFPGHPTIGATSRGLGDRPVPVDGSGGLDRLEELLVEADPVTGLPSAAVLLARLGRMLGAVSEPGWALGLIALHLVRPGAAIPLAVPSEVLLSNIAAALQTELRFDDLVARVDPRTFVVAVPLVEGDDEGSEVAAHLEATVHAIVTSKPEPPLTAHGAAGAVWTVRAADIVVPLPSDDQADRLVRHVVEAVRG